MYVPDLHEPSVAHLSPSSSVCLFIIDADDVDANRTRIATGNLIEKIIVFSVGSRAGGLFVFGQFLN